MTRRQAQIDRRTSETKIQIDLCIDGTGRSKIETEIPFFDHMLTLFARHSLCDLTVQADGDIEVDLHHTVEDTGIALGQAFAKALADKHGIRRYGWAYLPMDETLARVVIDFSGRPFLDYRAPEGVASVGAFSFTLLEEILHGRDAHHMCEAVFKGLAKAVDQACQRDPRVEGVPSTKGVL